MSYNNHIPNIKLINQNNDCHHFHDIISGNKIILLSMFYCYCDVKCIPVGKNLSRVNKLLSPFLKNEDIHFVSITLDSKNDNIDDLNYYINKVDIKDCDNWNFYTGSFDDIEFLRHRICMNDDNLEIDKDISQHNPNLLLINNKIGQVRHINGFENPINIARRLLQFSTNHFSRQDGCFLLKDLNYDSLVDDELFENILSINTRYTIPYLRKDILLRFENYSRIEKDKNGFNYKPLETARNRLNNYNNNNDNNNLVQNKSKCCCPKKS